MLDAALQAGWLNSPAGEGPKMPFVWSDVSLYAAGATALRVRLRQDPNGAVSLLAVDGAGSPVVSVGTLALRPVAAPSAAEARCGTHCSRSSGSPSRSPGAGAKAGTGRCAVVGADPFGLAEALAAAGADVSAHPGLSALADAGSSLPEVLLVGVGGPGGNQDAGRAARQVTNEVLALLRQWLALEQLADTRLVVVTRGAVAALPARGRDRPGRRGCPGPAALGAVGEPRPPAAGRPVRRRAGNGRELAGLLAGCWARPRPNWLSGNSAATDAAWRARPPSRRQPNPPPIPPPNPPLRTPARTPLRTPPRRSPARC
ncbi:hypothetical protein GXW82_02965 [Streptacidiphilus sp. 4-A2]|nr:hypothetical protein [Streptacidiphilus sp. 4-A2]